MRPSTFKTVSEQIRTLCSELFLKTPITCFVYFRFTRNRELITGMSSPDLYEFYIQHAHQNTDFQHRDYDQHIPQGSFFLDFISTQPQEMELTEIMKQKFNTANFVGIAHKNADYCDIYNFATRSNEANAANFFLNNIHLLEQYSEMLKAPLDKIIQVNQVPKIYVPSSKIATTININNDRIDNFSEVVTNTLQVEFNDTHKILTTRELQCLRLISIGQTSKEIARELNISPRTVDNYCERLKYKFGCRRRQDLIALCSGIFNNPELSNL